MSDDTLLAAASKPQDSPATDALIAGNGHLLLARPITLAKGGPLARGALLGRISASGEYILSTSAASDGSEKPCAVLVHAADSTQAAVQTIAYERGDFNSARLIYGAGHTAGGVREALRPLGIRLVDVYPAP